MADEAKKLAPTEAPEASLAAAGATDESDQASKNLDLILDIPLKVTVELGRTRMVVSELLNLGQGSVIELSKLAGEPMEVLVNNKLVARGEAVVVNEKFGVRLTDIISPTERVEQLGS
jgi:flagellar motor switch protein FliN